MGVFQFRTKLMGAVLLTFIVVALEAPAILGYYGSGKALAIALGGSRKMNAGRESRFQRAGHDSDEGEKIVSIDFRYRVRSLASKRVPSPPPTPMRNKNKINKIIVKTFATPHSVHRP
ncbi:uncharacterized protein LOC114915815 [Cajanus cajan]|uniref:uncharacterized protein LOC114915815 n=1 Tax=Cajanus cajan TaxID=3821 RepID=UPI0010FB3129|nr:uncharacterized protein LOC114915815 [Cajanus cajan]